MTVFARTGACAFAPLQGGGCLHFFLSCSAVPSGLGFVLRWGGLRFASLALGFLGERWR